MPELLRHHLVDDVAREIEEVETCIRHRELIGKEPSVSRLTVIAMRDAKSGFVGRAENALERFHRELLKPVVIEHAPADERRRDHRCVRIGVQRSGNGRGGNQSPSVRRFSGVVGIVCALRPEPTTIHGIGEPGLDVAKRVGRALGKPRDLQFLTGLQVQPREYCIQFQEFLDMRPLPITRGGISEESAIDDIVEPAPTHTVERRDDDPLE
jgi:hypothetical protein